MKPLEDLQAELDSLEELHREAVNKYWQIIEVDGGVRLHEDLETLLLKSRCRSMQYKMQQKREEIVRCHCLAKGLEIGVSRREYDEDD